MNKKIKLKFKNYNISDFTKNMTTIPNVITLLRIVLLLPYIFCLSQHYYKEAFFIFILAGFSDGLDGFLARTLNSRSNVGAFIDPLADKLLMLVSFISLYVLTVIPRWILFLFLLRDLIIVYGVLYVYFVRYDILKFEPVMISKINTLLQISLIFLLLLNLSFQVVSSQIIELLMIVILFTGFMSVVQYYYIWSQKIKT